MTEHECKFKVGDKVDKTMGYRFPGIVRAVFQMSEDKIRLVVELDDYGVLQFFSENQLKRRGP